MCSLLEKYRAIKFSLFFIRSKECGKLINNNNNNNNNNKLNAFVEIIWQKCKVDDITVAQSCRREASVECLQLSAYS